MTQAEIEKAASEYADRKDLYALKEFGIRDIEQAFLAGAEHARAKWIKCSERMPEPGHWVLIQGPYYQQPDRFWDVACYASYNGEEFIPDTEQIDGDYEPLPFPEVTHWMPLPSAPEAESK